MKYPKFNKDLISKNLFEIISDRKVIFLSIIAVLPILFNKYFESILDEYIGKPIFQNLESSLFSDIIFFIIAILLFFYYRYKYKNDHYFSSFDSLIVIIVGVWYCIYRFSGGWHYSRFYILPIFSYLDVFLIVFIFHSCFLLKRLIHENTLKIIICFLFIHRNRFQHKTIHNVLIVIITYLLCQKREYSKDTQKGFQTDKPIEEFSEEKLGRSNYAQIIAERINDSFPKESFAIGITGKWGSGKTSFLHLIKKNLNQNTIIVDFNAWHSHETKNLIADFFDLLKAQLNDGSVSQDLNLYVKQLTAVDDNIYFKTIDLLQKTIFGNQSTQEIFERINASIKRLNKQIVIFIDELDRLDNKEVIEIIKLIRISANFKNTVFVAAFDKGYVMNVIAEINSYEKEWFLEKIFQAEFPLPSFEKNRINNELKDRLKINIEKEYHQEIDDYFNSKQFEEIVTLCIKSLRDVTRFVNVFCLDFNTVKEEVLLKDFFNVELLKLKHLLVYESLSNSNLPDYLLTERGMDESGLMNEVLNFYEFNETKFDEYVESEKGKANGFTYNIDDIKNIIRIIFTKPPTSPNEKNKKDNLLSICRPSNFRIYYSMRLTEGKLSEVEFKNVRQLKDISKFKSHINNWITNGLVKELLSKFEAYEGYDNTKDFELITKGMLEVGQHFFLSKSIDKGIFYNFLITKMLNEYINVTKLYRFESNSKEQINDYNDFIKEVLDKQEYNFFFDTIFLQECYENYLFHQFAGIQFVKRDFIRLFLYVVNKYLREEEKIKNEFWELYSKCGSTKSVIKILNRTIKKIALERDIKGFLTHFVQKSQGYYYWHSDYNLFFPEKNSFILFCNKISNTEQKLKEKLIEFHNTLEKVGVKSIQFNFEGLIDI